MSFIGSIFRIAVEWSARKDTYADIFRKLEESGAQTQSRFDTAAETEKNIDIGNHIIGMERWGQRRLRSALGEELLQDEYDGYRPGDDLAMSDLRDVFRQTRADSIALARSLQEAGVATTTKVPHNDMGDVSIRAWFGYLAGHANFESKRLTTL